MKCPYCNSTNDRVIDSRSSQDGTAIRRRRECLNCRRRYRTYERVEEAGIKVIKKNGEREPFDREKIRAGLTKACSKLEISGEDIDRVVAAVESKVYDSFEEEIDSRRIGEIVMQYLRDLDHVAFVRFASVYQEFKDPQEFVDAVLGARKPED